MAWANSAGAPACRRAILGLQSVLQDAAMWTLGPLVSTPIRSLLVHTRTYSHQTRIRQFHFGFLEHQALFQPSLPHPFASSRFTYEIRRSVWLPKTTKRPHMPVAVLQMLRKKGSIGNHATSMTGILNVLMLARSAPEHHVR